MYSRIKLAATSTPYTLLKTMLPSVRQRSLRLLSTARDISIARDVEAACHANSSTEQEYYDHVRRAAFNLTQNSAVNSEVVYLSDDALLEGTLSGRIQDERTQRLERFRNMLQEKYESLNDGNFEAIVRCRRCGSSEVFFEEKQTRSADEAASVYCACITCKNRWVA